MEEDLNSVMKNLFHHYDENLSLSGLEKLEEMEENLSTAEAVRYISNPSFWLRWNRFYLSRRKPWP